MIELKRFVHDFAEALKAVDALRLQFASRSRRVYQAGMGPHSEDRAVDLIVEELRRVPDSPYRSLRCRVAYPNSRQTCDLVSGEPPSWRIEVCVKLAANGVDARNAVLVY